MKLKTILTRGSVWLADAYGCCGYISRACNKCVCNTDKSGRDHRGTIKRCWTLLLAGRKRFSDVNKAYKKLMEDLDKE